MVLIRPLGDHAPRFAELGGSNVDDCLGVSRLYFCALRNVETSSLKSARPKISAAGDSLNFRIPLDDAIGILERLADLIEEHAAGTVH
jgi:hypothetical protein